MFKTDVEPLTPQRMSRQDVVAMVRQSVSLSDTVVTVWDGSANDEGGHSMTGTTTARRFHGGIVAMMTMAAIAGVGATAHASSAPTDPNADTDAVMRYAVPGVVQSMDPRTANEFQQIFLEQVYEPLIRTTLDGDHAPGLATEWGLVDDGAAFELTLREDVTFQDGEPFDADAVVANLEAAAADGSNLASDLDVVESIEAVDDSSVRLELSGEGGHLPGVLAGYAGMMISPAAMDDDLQTDPVGAGPFLFTGTTETSVSFERWDGYYAADDVSIGGIEFVTFADETARLRALESGQLDAAFLSASQVAEAEDGGLLINSTTQTTVHAALINSSHEALGNDLVRQALMHSIDRDAIAQALYDGHCVATVQPYPAGFWAHDAELAASDAGVYDPDLAKELLAEAGYEDGFELTISTGSITIYQRLAEVLQQQFAAIGVTAEITVSTTLSDERRNGDFDVITGAFQVGRPDPSAAWATRYYASDGPLNFGGVEFEGVDDLIAESRSMTDPADRAEPMHQIIAQSIAQGPILLPVCIPESITAHHEGVAGIDLSVLGTRDFRYVTISNG